MSLAQDFTVLTRRAAQDVVVSIEGELDAATAPPLRAILSDLIDGQGNLSVVLDLSAMTFVDSIGLGVFAGAAKRLRARGGELVLAAPSSSTLRLFAVTGIDGLATIEQA